MSNRISSGAKNYKYFVGYLYENKSKPFSTILPKTNAYVKSYDSETKWMHFFIEDDELLKRYNDIWNDVSNSVEKEFDSKLIYNKRYLKTKIKSYGDEATDFHDIEIPKVVSNYACVAVISIDFILNKYESYYPQVLLKDCKYIEKEKNYG